MSLQQRFKKKAPVVVNASGEPRLLNIKQAALYLSVHEWNLRVMAKRGEIPTVRVGRGRAYLFDRHDLDACVDRNKIGAL